MMRSLSYLFVLTALTYSTNSNAAMWAAGDLTYANGETEVSAFVNSPGDTQLQAVLCSKILKTIIVLLYCYQRN